MARRAFRSISIALAVAVFGTALAGVAAASAATVVNGSFETGNLEGWSLYGSNPKVKWEAATNGMPLPAPFAGQWVATSNLEAPGTTILSQEVQLEAGYSQRLELTFGYSAVKPIVIPDPDTLESEGAVENHQVRVDVMKSAAPITSVAPSDILATVFASSESENKNGEQSSPSLEARRFSVDLSPFAGQTVRLRFAIATSESFMQAIVDDVSVTSALLPAPALPLPTTPSNLFTKGRLALNKRSGTGFLSVGLPGAGTLTATDVRRQVAVASSARRKGKPRPILIKTATVPSSGPETVQVPIRPTPAALTILKRTGKLPFGVKLTFTPAGGTAATQGYKGKLVRTLRPARR